MGLFISYKVIIDEDIINFYIINYSTITSLSNDPKKNKRSTIMLKKAMKMVSAE